MKKQKIILNLVRAVTMSVCYYLLFLWYKTGNEWAFLIIFWGGILNHLAAIANHEFYKTMKSMVEKYSSLLGKVLEREGDHLRKIDEIRDVNRRMNEANAHLRVQIQTLQYKGK